MDWSHFQDTFKKTPSPKKLNKTSNQRPTWTKDMHREELCSPLGMLLFSHSDVRRATFLPAKTSSASNPGSQTCLWLLCLRGRNCSSAQLQNFSSPRLWASLTSVPVWAIKIPFNNQHSPVWEAYSIILSKDPRLPWCFLAIFIIEPGMGLNPEEMHMCPSQTLPHDLHMQNGTFQGHVYIRLPKSTLVSPLLSTVSI